jgi:EAL domain-containing protein (putative c-di-GMP-specific phosphodiesterase class I)
VALVVLLRWHHPEHGAVAHKDCLALAEQSGLIISIGRWMLTQACNHLRTWHDRQAVSVPIRVDLTTHLTRDPDLVALVRATLAQTQLRPKDIQLGMPVEVISAGHDNGVDNPRTLADIKVSTVFTHYDQALGNLALLESLPVDGVELANPWTGTTAPEPDSVVSSAIASLVPLIHRAGATVTIAGIDTADHADWSQQIGTDLARGEALGPPVEPDAVPTLLRENHS